MGQVMNVEGCTALVTGANRGLGRTLAGMLVQRGARKVYAGARDPTAITDSRLTPVQLDVTSKEDISAAAAACSDVNVLINNAGVMLGSPALADDAEAALRVEFAVNVIGLLSVTTAFVPILQSNGGGAIANVLSVVSWYVYPFNATYCASKHAALALTDGLRIQLRDKGTTVTGVYAGFIDTDMAAHVSSPKASPEEVAARLLDGIQCGADHVCADEYSKSIFRTMFAAPESIEREMQAEWRKSLTASGSAP